MSASASRVEIERRYEANRSGKVTIGKCVLSERPKRSFERRFSLGIMRLREIERIIVARYGPILPETDDIDVFFRVVALSCSGQDLTDWARRWAPWSLSRAEELIEPHEEESTGRVRMLRADAVASLLRVTFEEREALGLNTIGACDVSKAIRKRIVRKRKRERDRQRNKEKRRAAGTKSRETYLQGSLSANKPWQVEGISRAAWYRRQRETSPSRVVYIRKGDTPVSPEDQTSVRLPPTPSPDRAAGGQGQGPKALVGVQGAKPLGIEDHAERASSSKGRAA